jgi:phosphoglycerol transferase MdoB-like AlkP superfamily enzyme
MSLNTRESRPARAFGLRFMLVQSALFVVLSVILRWLLWRSFAWHLPMERGAVWSFHALGVFGDLVVAAWLFLPGMLWLALVPARWRTTRWHQAIILAAGWLGWTLAIFVFQAEFYFFQEYNSRFNTVAIDYLHYWTEVSANVAEMYPVPRIITICVGGAAVVMLLLFKLTRTRLAAAPNRPWRAAVAWSVATAALTWGALHVDWRGKPERLINELQNNGLMSGAVALWTRDLDYAQFFPTLPREEAYARTRQLLDTPGAVWTRDPFSLQRRIPGDSSKPRLNVVLLMEESLGSEFFGCLNMQNGKLPGRSLTPNLDTIATQQGLLFSNLHADGNRTIRGLEAVLASFPPLPGDSILARTRTQDCETLAQVLRRDGYTSTFIYPGRAIFDGLGHFALGNGFDRMIEEKDFVNPVFTNTWGHCDEDLYDRVLAEARAAHDGGQPFFITALSVTNHQPFTFPDGRISEPSRVHSRKFAVKYVDYALGRFFEQVKREPFWQDTIFAVVADHGARVYGSQTVPILSYEIPLIVTGGTLAGQPRRVETPGCQLDVAPTLLGLIGRPYDTVFYGRDLLAPAADRFALLNHNRSIALYRGSEMVALSLGKVIERFTARDRKTLELQPLDAATREQANDATALFQTADELYNQHRYSVQPGQVVQEGLTKGAPPKSVAR